MKKLTIILIMLISLLMGNISNAQNVGIGSTSFTPDSSAILEIRGTKGLLIPRLSTSERDAIGNPAQSLLIFNTTTNCFETFVNGLWHSMWCDSCSSLNLTTSASPSTICSGNSSILTVTGADSYQWNTGDNTASITVSPSTNTTYSVTGTTIEGCTGTAKVTVTVHSLPNISATADPEDICLGESSDLMVSSDIPGTTFNWSNGLGTNPNVTISPTVTTTYSVTGTTIEGCTGTAEITVTVNPLPNISATATPEDICLGESSDLMVSSDIPGTTFTWSNSLGTNPSVTVSPTENTTYTVTGTSASCSATAIVSVIVNSVIPTITASASPSTICYGSSSTLSANGGTTYIWSTGSTNQTINVSPTNTTTYTVTGTTSGCTSTATINVTVNPSPSVTISASPTTICSDSSATLTANGATSYNWSTGSTNQTITVTPSSTTTYTVTGTLSGCSAIATITITVEQCCTPITPCPSAGPVTYNGFTYNTVQIGTQCWMIENLRTTKYRDGTDITDGTSATTWANTIITTGKWCPNQGTGSADGLFYDFYAASSNNICPTGWHVPTQYEFETLRNSAGGNSEGNKLKDNINWNGTNSCGWKGIYGGYRAGSGTYYDYYTSGTSCHGVWWTKTPTGIYAVDFRLYDNGGIQVNTYGSEKKAGYYIRCIKD